MAKNNKVWTPAGYLKGPFNSMVGKGESIIDYTDGAATLVAKGQYGKDTEPSSVQEGDENVIAGNDIDLMTGMTFAEQLAPYTKIIEKVNKGDKTRASNGHMSSLSKITLEVSDREKDKFMSAYMKPITDRQQALHIADARNHYNSGKTANYDFDKIAKNARLKDKINTTIFNLIPTVFGLGNSIAQYRHWKNNPIEYHDTYAANPYSAMALSGLASLRHNPYPELREASDAERRAAYANENAGLSSGQRYLGRLGLGIGAMRTRANVLADAQQRNNAYKANYYSAALNAGMHDAQRRQNAAQYGWTDYVSAHGRKTKGIETSMANAQNILNSFVKNWNTDKINRDTMDLFRLQLAIDEGRLNAYMDDLYYSRYPDKNVWDFAQDLPYASHYEYDPITNMYRAKPRKNDIRTR